MLRIGTRASRLALAQVKEVKSTLKNLLQQDDFNVVKIDTSGDLDKKTPISEIEGSDFFTKEIDDSLLRGEIDLALHSAKDLPDNLHPEFKIILQTDSIDPYDALVSKRDLKVKDLPPGAKIGTSSLRRKAALKNYRADFNIVDIRGNIDERLDLLATTELDAIVIASAALIRLGLERLITQRISFDLLEPHPAQGSLAILARKDFKVS